MTEVDKMVVVDETNVDEIVKDADMAAKMKAQLEVKPLRPDQYTLPALRIFLTIP